MKDIQSKKRKIPSKRFPIVGVGASAGGLEAFSALLKEIPGDTGMAYILVQHLDPNHESLLSTALLSSTSMPVLDITNEMVVKPNNIYVIPPNVELNIINNTLKLNPRKSVSGKQNLPINRFFCSLAENSGADAIAIILSGTATDGTEGLRVIKELGGFTFAQRPNSARYAGMPTSAIEAGVVDLDLSISDIAKEVVRLGTYLLDEDKRLVPFSLEKDLQEIQKILNLVKAYVGIDFHEYKIATIKRRILRRIAILNINTLEDYANLLKKKRHEAKLLSDDLLIHVTYFFRDASHFKKLREHIFPQIIRSKIAKSPIRIWVAGCSSGEEVYSIIMSLLDYLGENKLSFPIQVFATDISGTMIEKARAGFYAENLMHDLTRGQVSKFFTRVEGGYRISKSVRDLCIFVRHDLAKDPPFSRLDLISCRNVLIYFDQPLQKKILSTFHYCLNLPGFLLLGKTENVSSNRQLFSVENKVEKIFSKVNIPSKLRFYPRKDLFSSLVSTVKIVPQVSLPAIELSRSIDGLLLAEYAPCGVVVNEQLDILEYRGRTSEYLEQAPGSPDANLFRMLHEGLFIEIKMAIDRVMIDPFIFRKEGVLFHNKQAIKKCNIVVRKINDFSTPKNRLFLILFESLVDANVKHFASSPMQKKSTKLELEQEELLSDSLRIELDTTKAYLQSLIQNNQKTNDALALANDELVSGNEELQSLNEEMETAKEELQSSNEELTTVNDELNNRNHELGISNSDLVNLLNCVEIPILILGINREIRRFTPHARNILKLLPTDIGRSIDDINLNVKIQSLNKQIDKVIKTAELIESEVQDGKGQWFRIQIRPYRNSEDEIDGVVISLIDINILKRALNKAEWARNYANRIVESIQIPLLVLDEDINVLSANKAFYDTFGVKQKDTEKKSLYDLGISQWNIHPLKISLGEMLRKKTHFKNAEVVTSFPHLGVRTMSLSAISVKSEEENPTMILLAIEDITRRKAVELERRELLRLADEARREAEKANIAKDIFLATLSHELRTPLTSLLLQTQILRRGKMDEAKILHSIAVIESAANAQAQLIEDLLDISRIISGKLNILKKTLDLTVLVRDVIGTVASFAKTRLIVIESKIAEQPIIIFGDEIRLKQVIWNLVINAIKFSENESKVKIELKSKGGFAVVKVQDHGVGIEAKFLPKIFNRFSQSEDSITRSHGGMGLGLAIVKHIVDLHGGTVGAKSNGKNQGSCFTVRFPLSEAKLEPDILSKTKPKTKPFLELMGRRILIADDDVETMKALCELLQQSGASVMVACSAAEAMEGVRDFKPSALICDIAMPKEDGYSFMKRLRKLSAKEGGKIPAIALTAMAGELDKQKAIEAGFQAHLAKPVSFDHLLEVLIGLFPKV